MKKIWAALLVMGSILGAAVASADAPIQASSEEAPMACLKLRSWCDYPAQCCSGICQSCGAAGTFCKSAPCE